MKFVFLGFILAISTLSAQAKIEEEFYVYHTDLSVVDTLNAQSELVVDHLSSGGFELYGPKGTEKYLKDLNLNFVKIPKKAHLKMARLMDYPTYAQNTSKLQALAARFPNILKLTSVGKSVRGKDLWVMKISDNVASDEVEPEFKYISSMHGDEITGRELTIKLIEDLAVAYDSDSSIKNLIDNTEIYIMPSMNPDGSEDEVRSNSNGADLNRNFPDITNGEANSTLSREIETQAIMKFQASRNFALSANFHGGSVVVNYPWDSKYDRHPLDGLCQEISLKYADLNPEMSASSEFNRGITNGADWYVVRGGMQDWSYVFYNDLQVTIELSQVKWPDYSEISGFYSRNKDSMIELMKAIHQGAGFNLNNAQATGSVKISSGNKVIGTFGFTHGEFYKVLDRGAYKFEVTSNGQTKTFDVAVNSDVASNKFKSL